MRSLLLALTLVLPLAAADKYNGPRPPKTDVPYLLHADNLLETEVGEATNDTKKDTTVASIAGASSPVKTPLAEPVFLFKSGKIQAEKLTAWRLQSRNGRREVTFSQKKNGTKPLHLTIERLEPGLYRIEVDEALENGEYVLSPEGSNETFAFQVY